MPKKPPSLKMRLRQAGIQHYDELLKIYELRKLDQARKDLSVFPATKGATL